MPQSTTTEQNSPPVEGEKRRNGRDVAEKANSELWVLLDHASPTIEEISKMGCRRNGFGIALLLLQFMRKERLHLHLPLETLDLSDFSLSSSTLKLLLSSIPLDSSHLETLKCGPTVSRGDCLSVLLDFLRLKAGAAGGTPSICLKTLDLTKCDLDDDACTRLLMNLPPSLIQLDLSDNRLHFRCMEAVGSVLSSGSLSSLVSVDLSDNPLGPPGFRALSKGLSLASHPLPLQCLRLAQTRAQAEGVRELAEALKEKKMTSLQTLDLEGNEMKEEGLKHLTSAFSTGAVPQLRVLILKSNQLITHYCLRAFFHRSVLSELEVLDLSEDKRTCKSLSRYGGSYSDFEAVASPSRFPKLRRLDLGCSRPVMSSSEFDSFASGLGVDGASPLEEIVFTDGNRGSVSDGVVAFADALSSGHLPQLRGLTLHRPSDLRGEEFATLCESLTTGNAARLQTLDLEFRPVDPDATTGVLAIGKAMREKGLYSLESFRLSIRSGVGGAAMSALGMAMGWGGCPRLKNLDLEWAEEGDEGVAGIAEGLSMRGLSSLRDLSLRVRCYWEEKGGGQGEGEGEKKRWGDGCVALGEFLSTHQVPCLEIVRLDWFSNPSLCSLCEGLSRGRVPPEVSMDLRLDADDGKFVFFPEIRRSRSEREKDLEVGMTRLNDVIRADKLAGLRKVGLALGELGYLQPPQAVGVAFGEALAHAEFLEEVEMNCPFDEWFSAFLKGLSRGPPGCLSALRSLRFPVVSYNCSSVDAEGAQSLSAIICRGLVPSLSDLKLTLSRTGVEGMQALRDAFSSPHVSALRRLKFSFTPRHPEALQSASNDEFDRSYGDELRILSVAFSSGRLCRLTELKLKGIGGICDIRALCVGLGSGQLTSLRTLSLKRVQFTSGICLDGGVMGCRALSEALVVEKVPALGTLEVVKSQLRTEGLRALVEGWEDHNPPLLRHLNLRNNMLTKYATDPLLSLQRAKTMPSLECVDLIGNPLDEEYVLQWGSVDNFRYPGGDIDLRSDCGMYEVD
uniref:Uncharacterized protein n=1 Tax=Chromera velia CCMP2878 TaxID=1169474 RepID=A0A0K6SA66_9ALVE|eukprot:Cvel_8909.t1-p1 / transcript=Cvel_8909.t1 / gene=Cvel_8909 / organism=Chromera_velia_CCMP2878 / gene_product=hypothetical protein / transcript_product=hypothetical protein / location=Cvel_scaffold501:68026-73373(+) / protein_length=1015 / sequence_SO=supercontig / SO=protein_coding / is_pseudo=false